MKTDSDQDVSYINTKDFAHIVGVQSQTIRRSLCIDGHYLGVKPVKLPNHRLMWPREPIKRILQAN